jgi:hypothetical protein
MCSRVFRIVGGRDGSCCPRGWRPGSVAYSIQHPTFRSVDHSSRVCKRGRTLVRPYTSEIASGVDHSSRVCKRRRTLVRPYTSEIASGVDHSSRVCKRGPTQVRPCTSEIASGVDHR